MIFGNLMGGLGNQLFQIFATISYSIKNKHKFQFPANDGTIGTNRPPYWNNFLRSLHIFVSNIKVNYPILREEGFEYKELPICNPDKNYTIHGYFQSYKYFEEYFTTICRMIGLEKQQKQIVEKFPNNYSNMISMHFRLGDYKQLQDFHPILSYEYYYLSIHYIQYMTLKDDWEVLYFCEKEDNETVSKIINDLNVEFPKMKFYKQSDDVADWKQMLIMSCCYHNIIANSSFSWWGAYFNTNPKKYVCYPKKWFGPKLCDKNKTDDLFPEDWMEINN
jgi:hypothetical protein